MILVLRKNIKIGNCWIFNNVLITIKLLIFKLYLC